MSVVRTVEALAAPWRRAWWPDAALAAILCLGLPAPVASVCIQLVVLAYETGLIRPGDDQG